VNGATAPAATRQIVDSVVSAARSGCARRKYTTPSGASLRIGDRND
jgi:hypothetical protein